MMGLGTLLEEARLEQGLTIDEMADRTKIRPQFLQAIEEEDFNKLPGQAYVKPFVRTYARALGVEDERIAFDFEVSSPSAQEELTSIRERRLQARRARRIRFALRSAVILGVLVGVGYLLYRLMFV